MSILFLADDHFGSLGGRRLKEALDDKFDFSFHENGDYVEYLKKADFSNHSALVTCAIGDTCGVPHAPAECEEAFREWLETGVPVVLLHGGSATFWKWSWWRRLVGLRWVRGNDPDGIEPSYHPVEPYPIKATQSSHPLAAKLTPFDAPKDEIYLKLEKTQPLEVLLETEFEGTRYPLAHASKSQFGNPVYGYLPGHHPEVVLHPANLANVEAIIRHAFEG
jgi:hypothetical protein